MTTIRKSSPFFSHCLVDDDAVHLWPLGVLCR